MARHADLLRGLGDETPVAVDTALLSDGRWQVTIVGFNHPGELSIICGLLFAHGFNIVDGNAFSEEHVAGGSTTSRPRDATDADGVVAKFVDVFTVEPADPAQRDLQEVWRRYTAELADLIREVRSGRVREAQGRLAKRVAAAMPATSETATTLYPVEIAIDNKSSSAGERPADPIRGHDRLSLRTGQCVGSGRNRYRSADRGVVGPFGLRHAPRDRRDG